MSPDERTEGDPGEEPRVVVRDRRRIDPQTGQVRVAPEAGVPEDTAEQAGAAPAGETPGAEANLEAELKLQLDERTADLQRLQAEYANYRKRIDRDREAVINSAKAGVATELLGVLDDIERAEQHGDLTGAFKSVADKLVATLQRSGLEPFGHEGEPFDPSVHEAVQHNTSPEVSGPTVTAVLRRGYRFGDRVVRAALVAVTDHEPAAAPDGAAGGPAGPDWFGPGDGSTERN
ncbi:MAG TPA: nucleotide exchange factor GrpE [Actinophytocola sp.]|uniref:nucleotide exchange factor GrpE n=1 Tax=Actinophytocola sp. TaxID=1872138 RepID=UPI002DC03441|nr:nucleotide exchange factor GrpE [Actinophytocola sp.]HEU5473019.1 nucleotide exchange factor GrpE [Actinophytocola sp.]